MAKNRSSRTPTWAIMAGRPDGKNLPSKKKGKKGSPVRYELWADGKKIGVWETKQNIAAARYAYAALAQISPNAFYRLIEVSRWTDHRERSETIKEGYR